MNSRNRKEFEKFKELQELKTLFASIRGQSRNYHQYDADFFISDLV
jgi:hypothetical protein